MPNVARGRGMAYEKILCGDGTVQNGRTLLKGKFYAAVDKQNGLESYHRIDMSTYSVSGGKYARYSTIPETEAAKERGVEGGPRYRIHKSNARRARYVIRNAVSRFLQDNPGVAVTMSGPGARGASSHTAAFHLAEEEKVFKRGGALGTCMDLALANAVDRKCGRDAAKRVEGVISRCKTAFTSVGSVQAVLHDIAKPLNMRKLRGGEKARFEADKFKYVAELARGVWFVRVRAGTEVDHCVVIDAERKQIIDSEEMYPLRLCMEALKACCGDGATNSYIAELRELVHTRK